MRRIAAALFIPIAFSGGAPAQGWPEKPVRFVVGFTPGGPSDILARALGQKLAESRAQSEVLIAQHRRARASRKTSASRAAARHPDDATTLRRMRDKVLHAEAVGRAASELADDDVEERLGALADQDEIERMLAELKARRGSG